MPYCSKCGNEVGANARFCGKCGAAQPVGAGTTFQGQVDSLSGHLNERTASLLCYVPVVGWLMSLIVLASERFRQMRDVRFHAFQGLYLFVSYLLAGLLRRDFFDFNFDGVSGFVSLLRLAIVVTGIYMLIQTANGKMVKLPIIGEIADKSVDEQR